MQTARDVLCRLVGRTDPRAGLYSTRSLCLGYPELEARGLEHKTARSGQAQGSDAAYVMSLVTRLTGLEPVSAHVAVVGCGPRPITIRTLCDLGVTVIGVEPSAGVVEAASDFLGGDSSVVVGAAECLPMENGSLDAVFMESVLEHVDSASTALREAHRVLKAGGVAYITTTNALAVRNEEYVVPFFQWLPPLLKEALVFQHLHYSPQLARFSPRPAVHWFTYSSLCQLGREAGFADFCSKLDLVRDDDPGVRNRPLRLLAVRRLRYVPTLRALILTQDQGGAIFMRKRGHLVQAVPSCAAESRIDSVPRS